MERKAASRWSQYSVGSSRWGGGVERTAHGQWPFISQLFIHISFRVPVPLTHTALLGHNVPAWYKSQILGPLKETRRQRVDTWPKSTVGFCPGLWPGPGVTRLFIQIQAGDALKSVGPVLQHCPRQALSLIQDCLPSLSLFIFKILFLATLGLPCCMRAFSSWSKRGLLSSCRVRTSPGGGFSCCGAQAPDPGASVTVDSQALKGSLGSRGSRA